MEKCLLLAFTIFAISLMNAQERAFKITNTISQKEVIIKENKRVKVTTLDGTKIKGRIQICLLYTSPSPRDRQKSRMPSSA